MKNSDILDALLLTMGPNLPTRIRRLIDDSNKRLVAEFLEDLRDNDLDRTRLYKKWEEKAK